MAIGIGIELTPATLRAVVVEKVGGLAGAGQVKLLTARELPCETAQPEALTRSLTQLRQTLRMTQPIVLGIPGSTAILTSVIPLVVNARRASLAVQFELQQQLPFDVSEAAWHYHWLSAPNGHTVEAARHPQASVSLQPRAAVVGAMKRSLLDERVACCRRAGLAVRALAMSPLAALNVWCMHRGTWPQHGALLYLIDRQTAEWVVWSPTGLQVIPVASTAPESFLTELEGCIQALRVSLGEEQVTVWVAGSSAHVPHLDTMLKDILGLPLEVFEVTRIAALKSILLDNPESSIVPLGLALQGLGIAPVPLNLLAQTQGVSHSQQVQRTALMTSGVFAIAAIGFGLNGMREVSARRAQVLQVLTRQEQLYQRLRPEIRTLLQRQQHIERRNHQLERLVTDRALLTQKLSQVAGALPDHVWLLKLEWTRSEAGMEGLLEARVASFQDVTQLMDRLKTDVGMTTVKLLSSSVVIDEASKKESIAFAIQLQQTLPSEVLDAAKTP